MRQWLTNGLMRMSGGAKNFHLRAITQDVWGTEVPSEVRGKASVGGYPADESVCRYLV